MKKLQGTLMIGHTITLALFSILLSSCATTSSTTTQNQYDHSPKAWQQVEQIQFASGKERESHRKAFDKTSAPSRVQITAQKENKSDRKANGKLNAVGRIKEALKIIVAGPFAGAYIGTAGGYIPTYPGLVGGAAIGGVLGVAAGINILVTGDPVSDDSSGATARYSKRTTTTTGMSSTSLTGTWAGEYYKNAAWSKQIRLKIGKTDRGTYDGHILKFISGSNPDCRGADIKLNPVSGNLYSIEFSGGSVCQALGTLRLTDNKLRGKMDFKGGMGKQTVELSRLSGQSSTVDTDV